MYLAIPKTYTYTKNVYTYIECSKEQTSFDDVPWDKTGDHLRTSTYLSCMLYSDRYFHFHYDFVARGRERKAERLWKKEKQKRCATFDWLFFRTFTIHLWQVANLPIADCRKVRKFLSEKFTPRKAIGRCSRRMDEESCRTWHRLYNCVRFCSFV